MESKNERIEQLKSTIRSVSQSISSAVEGLNEVQLNKKPTPKAWSLGQILQHLIQINESYFPIMPKLKDQTYPLPFTGKIPFIYNALGTAIYKSVQPTQQKKHKTMYPWIPNYSDFSFEIVEKFFQSQDKLLSFFDECKPFIEKNQVISSPASKHVTYTLEMALEILTAHEERHLNQFMSTKTIVLAH